MQRPEFDNITSYKEFSKYYWYREELIKICKSHGLKSPSGKIELNKVIEAYFSGEKILPQNIASVFQLAGIALALYELWRVLQPDAMRVEERKA